MKGRTERVPGSVPAARKRPALDLLRTQQRELEKAAEHFETEVERLDRVAKALEDLVADWLSHESAGTATPPPRRVPAEAHVLRQEARAGASALAMVWNVDGSAEVRVNLGKAFRLQHRPAVLLSIISAPGGRSAGDGLVGWRSYAEVAVALEKHDGRPATPGSVTQTIYKLRIAFHAAEQNWFLVQTDRRGGVRFALRAEGTEAEPSVAPAP